MTELLQTESALSTLEQAQDFADWFAEYMYGMHDTLPNKLPSIVASRLEICFGEQPSVEQFDAIRDEFIGIDDDNQRGIALYFSGYPDDAIEMLLDNAVSFYDFLATTFPDRTRVTPIETATTVPGLVPERSAVRDEPIPAGVRIASVALADFVYLHGEDALDDIFTQAGDSELPWQARALCAQTDPEAFFPEKGGSTREAKKVCLSCEVRTECLHYALGNDERFGIWGGLSERERRKYKRRGTASIEQTGPVEPLVKRPRRIEQLLRMLSATQEETDLFFDKPEQFARLVYHLLGKLYPETDEADDPDDDRRERLLDYFVLEKKEQALHVVWNELAKDLEELTYEIDHDRKEYEVDRDDKTESYIMNCLASWQADDAIGVSRVIRKKPRWMREAAEQDVTSAQRVY